MQIFFFKKKIRIQLQKKLNKNARINHNHDTLNNHHHHTLNQNNHHLQPLNTSNHHHHYTSNQTQPPPPTPKSDTWIPKMRDTLNHRTCKRKKSTFKVRDWNMKHWLIFHRMLVGARSGRNGAPTWSLSKSSLVFWREGKEHEIEFANPWWVEDDLP